MLVGSGALALVVVVALVFFVALSTRRGSGEGGPQNSSAAARPAPGGPFMDSLRSQPVELWKANGKELTGAQFATFGYLLAANQNTALVSVMTSKDVLVAVDPATGKRKWQAEVPEAKNCELSEDGHAACWSTDIAGQKPKMGDVPGSTTWSFFAPDGSSKGPVVLSIPGEPMVRPLRDGFLVLLGGRGADAQSTAVSFSVSGEQRWKVGDARGVVTSLVASEPAGLFLINGTRQNQVYRLSDGQKVSDYSELTGGDATAPVRASLNATGFSAQTVDKTAFFDSQGKKTAGLDNWGLPQSLLGSSSSCEKVAVRNEAGFAVADPASGKILWQQSLAGNGDAETSKFGCVGGYLLARPAYNSATMDVYELSSGKRTGTVPVDSKTEIIGSDRANLLVRKGDSSGKSYEAYSLSDGQRLWTFSDTDNSYAVCGHDHNGPATGELVDGGFYRVQPFNSFTRLGAKP